MPFRRHFSLAAAFARREVIAVSAMLAALLLAGAFIKIAGEMAEGETQAIDLAIFGLLHPAGGSQGIGPQWLSIAALDITALGSVAVLVIVVAIVAGLFAALGHFRQASILVAATAGGIAWSQALKPMFDRPRPDALFHAVEVLNSSFPSGHALISASVYLTLGALAASFAKRRRLRAFALGAALSVTFLVGSTRVFLGVHYPSDVLAGWCFGGAWALSCWLALWLWQARWKA